MSSAAIRVLLVDDNELVRECIGAYLEDEGFSVQFAVSGEEALVAIAATPPTICITDLRLDGISGETLIEQACRISPGTGYLLHTGGAYILSDRLRLLGMTSDDIFFKPIHELATLTGRIRVLAAAVGISA